MVLIAVVLLLQGGAARAQAEFQRHPYELGYATRAAAMTAGPDGAVWFEANEEGGSVGRVTSAGEVTESSLPKGRCPRVAAIATGPDGNVWFSEKGAIGRIDMAGRITSYGLSPGNGGPVALTAGPDRSIWFVTGRGAIGRISSAGRVKEFALPPGREPSAITAGPDGNVWFTEPKTNAIGRITPTGSITEFPVPGGPTKELEAITVGADGDLWFGELGATRIGRITTAGVVTQFKVPTETGTRELVAGPGGLVYFISGDQVAAIDAAGKVSWPSCINDYCDPGPNALAVGSDGGLWVSTGLVLCLGLCGGGAAIGLAVEPGHVLPYALPPLRFGIGPRPTRLHGDRTTLLLACGVSAPCQGELRLGHYVYLDHKRHFRALARRPYGLAPGESRRVSLLFSPAVADSLRHHRSHRLIARADEEGQTATRRRVWLKS